MTNHSYYIANIVFCFNESPIHADKIYGRQGNTRTVPGLIFPLQENTLLADILHELLLFYLLHVNAHDLMLAFHERILES